MSTEDKTVIAHITRANWDPAEQNEQVASFVQYNGQSLGKRYTLSGEVLNIGRSVDADITIAEPSVSRIHARVTQRGSSVSIEDLGSANGTYVNELKVDARQLLADQDMLQLGNVLLKFFSHDNMDGFVQDKIYRMATIDAGTSIYNKMYLLEALEQQFALSRKTQRPLAVIYYDLDHFKKVNDTYGHNAGDQVLRESAQLVQDHIRREDVFGRYGGEEFVVLLPNTDATIAAELGQRILRGCAAHPFALHVEVNGTSQIVTHYQTLSIGIAVLSPSMGSAKDLLEAADQKLYQSKQTGRNRVSV